MQKKNNNKRHDFQPRMSEVIKSLFCNTLFLSRSIDSALQKYIKSVPHKSYCTTFLHHVKLEYVILAPPSV